MTKEELIAKSKKALAEKEEAKHSGGYQKDYEETKWGCLVNKQAVVFRFLGGTPYARELPTDPKIIHLANVVGDDGKNYKFTYPDKKEHKDHFLWRFTNKVLSYDWDDNKPDGEKKSYTYLKSHPDLVNRILHNGKKEYYKGDKGALPQNLLICNIVDYMDSWCKDNKHSKLASKGAWKSKSGIEGCDTGLTGGFFDNAMEELIENYGWWDEYQSVIFKDTDKGFKAYGLYHIIEDAGKVKKYDLESYIKTKFDDESDYELYDIDKLYPISTYHKIKKVWGIFIQAVDKALNTEFYIELESLVAKEKEEFDKLNPSTDEKISSPALKKPNGEVENPWGDEAEEEEAQESVEEVVESVKPPVRRKPAVEKSEPAEKVFNINDYIDIFPFVDKLDAESKAMIVGYDDNTGEFLFKEGLPMFECDCGIQSPETNICFSCGVKYK